jgi:hypothetical protein
VLVLSPGCYKAARLVKASELPVVLDPQLVFWETDPRTNQDRQVILPKVYRDAGVPITYAVTGFASSGLFRSAPLPPTIGTNFLWFQAATDVKHGGDAAQALEAITLRPAKFLGIEATAGSLQPGRDGDVAILSGDPLKLGTWVEKTLVRGKVVYDRDKDEKMKDLTRPPKGT